MHPPFTSSYFALIVLRGVGSPVCEQSSQVGQLAGLQPDFLLVSGTMTGECIDNYGDSAVCDFFFAPAHCVSPYNA
jgi:hypothetical protein